jgi:hypothetical protein
MPLLIYSAAEGWILSSVLIRDIYCILCNFWEVHFIDVIIPIFLFGINKF